MKRKSKRYSILELNFKNVRVDYHPEHYQVPADMRQKVEGYWTTKRKQKHLFNGLLARLDSWCVEKNTLILHTSITDYQTLLYSNSHIQQLAAKWGKQYYSRALGISALLVSRDQFLILMRRSNKVGEYRNCIDVFGGHINLYKENEKLDINRAMLAELEEEVGLLPIDVDLEYAGLIQSNTYYKPELLFIAKTQLSVGDIITKSNKARDRFEYTKIIVVPVDRQSLTGFLKANVKWTSPSAYGSLELFIQKVYL